MNETGMLACDIDSRFYIAAGNALPDEWLVTCIFDQLGIAWFAGWLLGLFGRGAR